MTQKSPKERIIPIRREEDDTFISSAPPKESELNSSKEFPTPSTSIVDTVELTSDESDQEPGICASFSASSEQQEDCISDDEAVTITKGPLKRTLASYNVPEKIIIVFDQAVDDNSTSFEMVSGKKYPPLFMLQHAVQIFLHNKAAINNHHEFALILLNDNTASWVHDFTSSPHDIIASLETVTPCEPEDIFNFNTVFDLINENVKVPPTMADLLIPPAYVVRIVLIYGRSYSIPALEKTIEIEQLLSSPYFTIDVVMTHEPPSSANHCDKIFKILQKIDMKGLSYSFAVSRNAGDLHQSMAKVLSHPLQRPPQHSRYNIKVFK